MAVQALANLRLQQSSALAYFDSFIVFAALSIPLRALAFLMNAPLPARVHPSRRNQPQ